MQVLLIVLILSITVNVEVTSRIFSRKLEEANATGMSGSAETLSGFSVYVECICRSSREPARRRNFLCYSLPRKDKGDREGIPHTHPIPYVIRLELFLESG